MDTSTKTLWLTRLKRFGILAALALVVFLIINELVMPVYTRQGDTILLPDVTGLPLTDAQDVLMSEGFRIMEQERTEPNHPPGTVIQQSPNANTRVKEGRKVLLTISRGLAPVVVPKIQGSQREAEITIQNAALRLGRVDYAVSNHFPVGVVMFQSMPAGSRIPAGSYIDITLSLGRVESHRSVPAVSNINYDLAQRMILQSGLTPGRVDTAIYPEYLPNTVLWQDREPGTTVQLGDTLNVIISTVDTTYQYSPRFRRFLDTLIREQQLDRGQ
jgi:eukaryotic-like serine/threonine-protein kinase